MTLLEHINAMKSFKDGRIKLINTTHTFGSFQTNSTPLSIVDKMIMKTSLENKRIMVMFNLEFLEQLIFKFLILFFKSTLKAFCEKKI